MRRELGQEWSAASSTTTCRRTSSAWFLVRSEKRRSKASPRRSREIEASVEEMWVQVRGSGGSVVAYLGDGRCTTETWRSLSGRGARREWPEGRGQIEGLVPRQLVEEGKSRSLARGCARGRSIGMEARRRLYARQVFDAKSALRARAMAAIRKVTNERARARSSCIIDRRPVARLLGQCLLVGSSPWTHACSSSGRLLRGAM
jgi:hypothetical protein